MNLKFYKDHTKALIDILNKEDMIDMMKRDTIFYDEPRVFSIGTTLKSTKDYSDGLAIQLNGFGYSFESPHIALFKSLFEAFERFSNSIFRHSDTIISSYKDLSPHPAIHPNWYNENHSHENLPFGWTMGENITLNEDTYIPMQSTYLGYVRVKNEPYISDGISTGAAAGLDKESTLLRGIYEIIERDVFMTMYLNSITPKKVSLHDLHWNELDKMIAELERYHLELVVLDITNDLEVPTYVAILIDHVGIGPGITLGLKASYSQKTAILGSIEESCLVRPWLRDALQRPENRTLNIEPDKINTMLQRGLFWANPNMLHHLDFFMKTDQIIKHIPQESFDPKDELNRVVRQLEKLDMHVYNKNVTAPFLKDTPYQVHKVTIPKLQPLYLHEPHKEFRPSRLRAVAKYFHTSFDTINPIPHPFL